MKNLKLRIWDKELEYMGSVRLIDFETNTIYANDKSTGICHSYSDFVYDDGVSHPISNIIMMRPSGLYDKNGKEIYEGDVVWCRAGEHLIGIWEYEKQFIVEYGWSQSMWEMSLCNEIEVIGNIYDKEAQP